MPAKAKASKAPSKPSKAKSPVKKSAKAPVKARVKTPVKAKPVSKPVVHVKAHPNKVPHTKPTNESIFARLLREKAERHQQYLKQNEHGHQSHDSNRMPHNHASYSKFAGPRRRAS